MKFFHEKKMFNVFFLLLWFSFMKHVHASSQEISDKENKKPGQSISRMYSQDTESPPSQEPVKSLSQEFQSSQSSQNYIDGLLDPETKMLYDSPPPLRKPSKLYSSDEPKKE